MTRPIVDSLPAVVEIDAEIDSERARESAVMERAAKVRQEHARAHARWESEAVEAELSGKRVPKAPVPPDMTVSDLAIQRVRANVERLVKARMRAIVDAADPVWEQAYAEVAAVTEEARPLVEALQALVPRARAATAAVDAVTDARQATDTLQRTTLRKSLGVDVSALLAAVGAGPAVLLAGRDPRPERVLGFQQGATLGEQGAQPETRQTVTQSTAGAESVTVVKTSRGAGS